MPKKLDTMPYSKCPECGKENMVKYREDPGWCNDMHRLNYKYKHRGDDERFK